MRPLRCLPAVAAAALALAGCGEKSEPAIGAPAGAPELTVSAATSLKQAVGAYAEGFPGGPVRTSFAGSDQLAAQIRQGARPDVFAAANKQLPDALYAEKLVEKPTVFAANRLVLAVPAGEPRVRSLEDLERPGLRLAVGAPSVPVGSYTREVLDRLPPDRRGRILANVRSNEPDVGGVVGKLTQGAVDAGFVYVTDVVATNGRLEAIELPANLEPKVAYEVAVVRGTRVPDQARRFVDGLIRGEGAEALRRAGFEPPPRP
jgi:molybdate transport system substrate-binding protein